MHSSPPSSSVAQNALIPIKEPSTPTNVKTLIVAPMPIATSSMKFDVDATKATLNVKKTVFQKTSPVVKQSLSNVLPVSADAKVRKSKNATRREPVGT